MEFRTLEESRLYEKNLLEFIMRFGKKDFIYQILLHQLKPFLKCLIIIRYTINEKKKKKEILFPRKNKMSTWK